jgi:hypothetical protein
MTTHRQREQITATGFVIAWCGGTALPYTWTGDPGWLWIGSAVLGGAAVIFTILYVIMTWIERGE